MKTTRSTRFKKIICFLFDLLELTVWLIYDCTSVFINNVGNYNYLERNISNTRLVNVLIKIVEILLISL
jgi:hypothetical protein